MDGALDAPCLRPLQQQIREKPGSCKPAKTVRSAIGYCTGESGISNEETSDYCTGWIPKTKKNMAKPECLNADEYTYRCEQLF